MIFLVLCCFCIIRLFGEQDCYSDMIRYLKFEIFYVYVLVKIWKWFLKLMYMGRYIDFCGLGEGGKGEVDMKL